MAKLLDSKLVKLWISNPTGFIKKIEDKHSETEWGRTILIEFLKINHKKSNVPHSQWTTLFGETIGRELIENKFGKVWKPKVINGYAPDWESDEFVWEIKTGAYYTNGTAHEKILGVPFKYAEIPRLYGKELRILLIAKAETEAVRLGIINPKSDEKKKYIEFFKSMGAEYVTASSLLT